MYTQKPSLVSIEDFNKAIQLKENYAEAYSNRGGVYRLKGEYDRAIKDCNMAIRLDPNLPEAYNNRGIVYKLTGDMASAVKDYNTAIKLDPSFAYAYYNRGIVYYEREEYDLAKNTKTLLTLSKNMILNY